MISRRLIEAVDGLLKRERGTVYKDPGGRLNVCLVYPNTYYVGMSNLGFQGVYGLLNSRADVLCERAFLPEDEDLKEFERTGSVLFSYETKRPLMEFDIVAFSVSFENDYLSIPTILELSRIPLYSVQRDERHPLLLLGGVCATSNPEPLAEFFDIVYIGEAEPALLSMVELYRKSTDRASFLKELSGLDGFYIPGFYRISYHSDGTIREREALNGPQTIKKVTLKSLKQAVRHVISTPDTEFSEMALVEAMRGCVHSCRFCLAGHIYNPPRYKDFDQLKREIEDVTGRGLRVGLIGPSLSDYKYIENALLLEGVNFSITSLRANKKTEALLHLFKGKKSLSIAPEAGTQRLRDLINKRISEEDILSISERVFSEGIEVLRLYFMIGLPTETEEDISAIVELAKKIRRLSRRGRLTLSISTFVPKPFTPFQWLPMQEESTVKRRLRFIKDALKAERQVTVFHDVLKYAYLQGVLSRGDRRLSRLIASGRSMSGWKRRMVELGLKPDFYLFRRRHRDEILPWDFIDAGVKKDYLWRQLEGIL
ncbi:MAG: radical SAM protein [Nitrospirae bacterium]|nr:MAG: radical SAM protein [Nitrospirota bacterium]